MTCSWERALKCSVQFPKCCHATSQSCAPLYTWHVHHDERLRLHWHPFSCNFIYNIAIIVKRETRNTPKGSSEKPPGGVARVPGGPGSSSELGLGPAGPGGAGSGRLLAPTKRRIASSASSSSSANLPAWVGQVQSMHMLSPAKGIPYWATLHAHCLKYRS